MRNGHVLHDNPEQRGLHTTTIIFVGQCDDFGQQAWLAPSNNVKEDLSEEVEFYCSVLRDMKELSCALLRTEQANMFVGNVIIVTFGLQGDEVL